MVAKNTYAICCYKIAKKNRYLNFLHCVIRSDKIKACWFGLTSSYRETCKRVKGRIMWMDYLGWGCKGYVGSPPKYLEPPPHRHPPTPMHEAETIDRAAG